MQRSTFDKIFLAFWWVPLFFLACFLFFEQGQKKRSGEYDLFANRLNELQVEKDILLEKQNQMKRELNSQSDPAWVELTLMKVLGVVPEGQKKVFFQND